MAVDLSNPTPQLSDIQGIKSVIPKAGFWAPATILLLSGWSTMALVPKEESFRVLTSFHSPWLDVLMRNLTYLGDGFMLLLAVLVYLATNRPKAWRLALAGIATSLVVQSLKHGPFSEVARPSLHFKQLGEMIRSIPGVEQHAMNSFPSGHSASAFALFWMLALLNPKRRYAFPFFILATLAAYSRIYLGQHFFNDTIAGATIGMLVATIVYLSWPIKTGNK